MNLRSWKILFPCLMLENRSRDTEYLFHSLYKDPVQLTYENAMVKNLAGKGSITAQVLYFCFPYINNRLILYWLGSSYKILPNDIDMIELSEQVDFLHTILSRFLVNHFKDLDLFQGDHCIVRHISREWPLNQSNKLWQKCLLPSHTLYYLEPKIDRWRNRVVTTRRSTRIYNFIKFYIVYPLSERD